MLCKGRQVVLGTCLYLSLHPHSGRRRWISQMRKLRFGNIKRLFKHGLQYRTLTHLHALLPFLKGQCHLEEDAGVEHAEAKLVKFSK